MIPTDGLPEAKLISVPGRVKMTKERYRKLLECADKINDLLEQYEVTTDEGCKIRAMAEGMFYR